LGRTAAGWLTAGRCYNSGKNRRKRGRACSPPRQRVRDDLGDGEAAVAEIDVAAAAGLHGWRRLWRWGEGVRGAGE
jgi:hypothetical protein